MPALTNHERIRQPDSPTVHVWRYMDFAKFVYMINTNYLYFSRLDQFDDPYEGTLSRAEYEAIHRKPQSTKKLIMHSRRQLRLCTYANCWYMNDDESEAMWKLYSNEDSGVAIETSYATLASSIPDIESIQADNSLDQDGKLLDCHIGVVDYIDHHTEEIVNDNVFQTVMQKRKSLAYEQEVRIVIPARQPGVTYEFDPEEAYPKGLIVPIDVNELITSVVVSPTSPSWFFRMVKDVAKQYGGRFPVKRSGICARPYI